MKISRTHTSPPSDHTPPQLPNAVDGERLEMNRLSYTVASTSSTASVTVDDDESTAFHPNSILINSPKDPLSRWISSNPTHYLLLRLVKPAIINKIGFGKYFKPHPSNCASYKLELQFSSSSAPSEMNADALKRIFDKVPLDNNHLAETIDLVEATTVNGNLRVPVSWIAIYPLAPHTPNYNISIWHVWLEGDDSPAVIKPALKAYNHYQLLTSSHLILAHLRHSHLFAAFTALFNSLPATVTSTFEHPLLTELHDSILFPTSDSQFSSQSSPTTKRDPETILQSCWNDGIINTSTELLLYTCSANLPVVDGSRVRPDSDPIQWVELSLLIQEDDQPRARTGHTMVKSARNLILYGGFDGTFPLDDLWIFPLPRTKDDTTEETRWRKLEDRQAKSDEDGNHLKRPRGRISHTMTVDPATGWIYILGGNRPIDEQMRKDIGGVSEVALASDFWRFRPPVGSRGGQVEWECLSRDTALESGPPLLFDHAALIAPSLTDGVPTLYIYGGRVFEMDLATGRVNLTAKGKRMGGLYSFNLESRVWKCEFSDELATLVKSFPSRVSPNFVYSPLTETLHISGGKRNGVLLDDEWTLSGTNLLESATPRAKHEDEPSPRRVFTQRRIIEGDTMWAWNPSEGDMWKRSLGDESKWVKLGSLTRGSMVNRLSSQMVLDPLRNEFYFFGGTTNLNHTNAYGMTKPGEPQIRVADLWRAEVITPDSVEILRKAKFILRKQKFKELTLLDTSLSALLYLQSHLSLVVDHSDGNEAAEFRKCMTELLLPPPSASNNGTRAGTPVRSSSRVGGRGKAGADDRMDVSTTEKSDDSEDDSDEVEREPVDEEVWQEVLEGRTRAFEDVLYMIEWKEGVKMVERALGDII